MKRGSKTTPAQLAAGGLVEYAPGRWRKAAPGVKQSLTTEAPASAPPYNDALERARAYNSARGQPAPKNRGQWAPYRNKTEWRFAQYLADSRPGCLITYEALRLPLASIDGKPSHYTSDFQQWRGKEVEAIYEVKGGHKWRRQGIDRLRAAAAAYPEWEWYLAEWIDGQWKIQRVEG